MSFCLLLNISYASSKLKFLSISEVKNGERQRTKAILAVDTTNNSILKVISMNALSFIRFSLLILPIQVFAEPPSNVTVPIDVTVDTGSHTCTSIGQEKKVYKDVYAGDGRYFVNPNLGEVSHFGRC